MEKKTIKHAFYKSIPILCSYVFMSIAYGMMMQKSGFAWYISLVASAAVYTGAFQFVLITFLSSGASLITVALTAFLMNSRQSFYSLSYLDDFNEMKHRKWYMVQTLTDETYAVNSTLHLPRKEKQDTMFFIALFSHLYWIFGSIVGGVLGQLIPFQLEGIDFCMTALFIIIFIDQWENSKDHRPAMTGMLIGIACLFLFGKSNFMLPALLATSAVLLLFQAKEGGRHE